MRAIEEARPPHKVTDYSSSSEDSDSEEDDEVEQELGNESTSGTEDSRARFARSFVRLIALMIALHISCVSGIEIIESCEHVFPSAPRKLAMVRRSQ